MLRCVLEQLYQAASAREVGVVHLLTPWPLFAIFRCMQAKRAQLRGVLNILQHGCVARCFVAWRELAQVGGQACRLASWLWQSPPC